MVTKVPNADGIVELILQVPAGTVYCHCKMNKGQVESVSFDNVPSYYHSTVQLDFAYEDHVVPLTVDVCFGGNYFGLITIEQLNWIKIDMEHAAYISKLGVALRSCINAALAAQRVDVKIALVEIYDESAIPTPRNAIIFGDGQIDRSPCGSGTSAKLAYLYHHHLINIGDHYRYRSICNTEFVGMVVREATASNGICGIIPRITGAAYITGWSHFMLSGADPFTEGLALH